MRVLPYLAVLIFLMLGGSGMGQDNGLLAAAASGDEAAVGRLVQQGG